MNKNPNVCPKPVLVTGASSGIGESTAIFLAKSGYMVYAGVRKDKDFERLDQYDNIAAVKLDVTSDVDVEATVDLIKENHTGLYGLINNAGIAVAGPLMDIKATALREQFEVNMIGLHRVTKALFPFILESKGRIIMISSDSGFFATPFFGPYCASKFAVEGYADSLRRELLLYDIKVVIIQPGRVTTKVWDKGEKYLNMYQDTIFAREAQHIGEYAIRKGKTAGLDPIEIAKLVKKTLEVPKPKTRYLIAPSTFKYRMIKILSDKAVDRMIEKELREI